MSPEVLEEPFTLTQGDLLAADIVDPGITSATIFRDFLTYQVPTGIGLIILPGHTFAIYIEDTDGDAMADFAQVKVEVMDAAKQDRRTILGPVLYKSLQEFTDRDKMARFNVSAPVKVFEKQYIVIAATSDGTDYIDGSECYFEMNIQRIRQPL